MAYSLFVLGAALQLLQATSAPDFAEPHLKQIAIPIFYVSHSSQLVQLTTQATVIVGWPIDAFVIAAGILNGSSLRCAGKRKIRRATRV